MPLLDELLRHVRLRIRLMLIDFLLMIILLAILSAAHRWLSERR